MVDFPDVLRQLGIDIFKGEGWEKFDSKKNLINENSLDHNEIEDFIYRITEEIWENKKVENIRNYYSSDVIVRSPSITTYDCDTVVQATYKTLEQFPDRQLIGEDVISFGSIKSTYLSSHRILSTGTHLGDGFYGEATGKKVIYRVIADCLVVNDKIVEEWIIRDEASILNQLGFKVSDFVEQRISDGTFKKNDLEFTKNSFVKKNIMTECENIYAKTYKNSIINLIEDKFSFEKKVYERSAQLYWFGGELINTVENIYEKWNLFLSCFKILKCEVSNSIALDQNNMRPRAAMRWRLICLHNSNGLFGLPTNKEIEIYGISHAEFGKQGIVREFILIDEISIWKQLLL
jgi:predicted ester cyclase